MPFLKVQFRVYFHTRVKESCIFSWLDDIIHKDIEHFHKRAAIKCIHNFDNLILKYVRFVSFLDTDYE